MLDALTTTVPLSLKLRVAFTHARRVRVVDRELGWLQIRLPQTRQLLWALVAHDPRSGHDLVLITNMPVRSTADARTVCTEWRHRTQIENTYRFDQEDGLDVEDMRVQTLDRVRRIFVLVRFATLLVYHIAHAWPQPMVLWLRHLGGKLGLCSDIDGPYVLLADTTDLFLTASTLAFAANYPFPGSGGTYG